MVFPPTERPYGRTLEDRLADKFDALQVAREEENEVLFDALSESIENLFIGFPDAYKELITIRLELDRDLDEELMNIKREASYASDSIDRDALFKLRKYEAEWEYRKEYERVIMEVMQKYRLIPMYRPVHSRIELPSDYIEPSSNNQNTQQIQQPQKQNIENNVQQRTQELVQQQVQAKQPISTANLTPNEATNIVSEPEKRKSTKIFRKRRKRTQDEPFEI